MDDPSVINYKHADEIIIIMLLHVHKKEDKIKEHILHDRLMLGT